MGQYKTNTHQTHAAGDVRATSRRFEAATYPPRAHVVREVWDVLQAYKPARNQTCKIYRAHTINDI